MKIIVIGDVHGVFEYVEDVLKNEPVFDKVVFLGDYWDSFFIHQQTQSQVYTKIRNFRDENEGRVITLLGNHEYHYLFDYQYSGWNYVNKVLAHPVLEEDYKNGKLPIIYKHGDIIFSHAGITNYWFDNVYGGTMEELINGEINYKKLNVNHDKGHNPYGDTTSNSPLWVRPKSLISDNLIGFKQVVGHTYKDGKVYGTDSLWFCDTFHPLRVEYPMEYLVIENDEFIVKSINK